MKTKTRNRIADGYTRRGFIEAVKDLHDALEFVYRPMLAEQVEDLDFHVEKSDPKESVMLVASAMAAQLTEWSEVEGEGTKEKPVPLSIDNIRRLPYPVLSRLRRIVSGVIATDELPNASDSETSDYIAGLKVAAKGGEAGQEQLRNDVKN